MSKPVQTLCTTSVQPRLSVRTSRGQVLGFTHTWKHKIKSTHTLHTATPQHFSNSSTSTFYLLFGRLSTLYTVPIKTIKNIN